MGGGLVTWVQAPKLSVQLAGGSSGREDRQVEPRLEFCRRGLMDAQGSGVLVERSGRSKDSG